MVPTPPPGQPEAPAGPIVSVALHAPPVGAPHEHAVQPRVSLKPPYAVIIVGYPAGHAEVTGPVW